MEWRRKWAETKPTRIFLPSDAGGSGSSAGGVGLGARVVFSWKGGYMRWKRRWMSAMTLASL